MQTTSIEVDGLHRSWGGQSVLRGVSFAAGVKRMFGVAGRDSAGRATTVAILEGLCSRDGGEAPRQAILGWVACVRLILGTSGLR